MTHFTMARPEDALAQLMDALSRAPRALGTESAPIAEARGRVLATDVASPGPIPEFRRSTVDGFAVRSEDTSPGTELRVDGEIAMGSLSERAIAAGTAIKVHTGGHVPAGADAIVMIERTRASGAGRIALSATLASGENIIGVGEDVEPGSIVIRAGTILREQEIAGLGSLGHAFATVRRRPKVAIISSGDELVPVEGPIRPGQVRGTNAPMLAALIRANGGEPIDLGILPDEPAAFADAARLARTLADVIVFVAGSSMSDRDFAAATIAGLGKPGILVHGIAFRPGKPTIFAVCDGLPVFGLPGNPNSALVTAIRFLVPTLWRLAGAEPPPPRRAQATLTQSVRSPSDLEHWIPAALTERAGTLHAEPIITKSNLIFGLVRADGMFCVPIGATGADAGTRVDVHYFY